MSKEKQQLIKMIQAAKADKSTDKPAYNNGVIAGLETALAIINAHQGTQPEASK